MTDKDWTFVESSLRAHFPNDSDKEFDRKCRVLKSSVEDNRVYEPIIPYILDFHGIVLRVGIISEKHRGIKRFFETSHGSELNKLLQK